MLNWVRVWSVCGSMLVWFVSGQPSAIRIMKKPPDEVADYCGEWKLCSFTRGVRRDNYFWSGSRFLFFP